MKTPLVVLMLALTACAGQRTTTFVPSAPRAPGILITNSDRRELLHISANGKTWIWSAKPEEVILQLIEQINQLQQQLNSALKPAPVVKKK